MTGLDWERVEPLLEKLLDLPPEEHADFVARECGGDRAIERRLLALVAGERDRAFLAPLTPIPGSTQAGERVGPYRLVRILGRGGMGEVWLGERDDGAYHKQVAIKLVQRGLATDDLMRRFEVERQVLAWLEHPGIAHLVDGGVRQDGRPFLVMEYVDGVPIDRYCRDERLSTGARIELFLAVGAAVQHAHERGVVHRDLKPGNVLVDSTATPRLLDFGIAKVLGVEDEHEAIELTRTGQRLYSPLYASPEQVRGEATGAATDVYSLGVLLCELLTGSRPYDARTTSQLELERLVCETRPARPSDLVSQKSARSALRGDIDWIVGTALRKETGRRYASVKSLCDDLRRHLAGERVLARPDSPVYRLKIFARRNRAGALGVAALVVGLVASLVLWRISVETGRESQRVAYASVLQAAEAAIRGGAVHVAEARLESAPPDLRGWEWRHLHSRLDHGRGVFPDNWSPLQTQELALSPDGTILAVRELDALELRNTEDGRLLRRRPLYHSGSESNGPTWNTSVSYHPSGAFLATTCRDGMLCVLRTDTLETLAEVKVGDCHLYSAEYDPQGRWLACALQSGEIVIYESPGLEEVARWVAHDAGQMQLSFNGAGDRLLSASWDERVLLWSVPGFELEREFNGHSRWVKGAAFAGGGELIVTASLDGTARVWPIDGDRPGQVFRAHGCSVNCVVISADGEEAITGGDDGRILRWGVRDAKVHATLVGHRKHVNSIVLGPEGRLYSSSSTETLIKSWSPGMDDVKVLEGVEYQHSIALNPSHDELAVGQPGGQIQRWSLGDLMPLQAIPSPGSHVLAVAYSDGGARLHACTHDGWIRSWTVPDLVLVSERHVRVGPIGKASFNSEGSWVVTTSRGAQGNTSVHRFETAGPGLPGETLPPLDSRSSVHLVRGDTLLTGGADGSVWRFDVSGRRKELILRSDPVSGLAADPAGRRLLVGSEGSVALWEDGKRIWVTRAIGEIVLAAAFHPTEPRVVIGTELGGLEILDARDGRRLVRLAGHAATINELVFSADGDRLFSCSMDGTVRVWDTQ